VKAGTGWVRPRRAALTLAACLFALEASLGSGTCAGQTGDAPAPPTAGRLGPVLPLGAEPVPSVAERVEQVRRLAREAPDQVVALLSESRPAGVVGGHVRLVAIALLDGCAPAIRDQGRQAALAAMQSSPTLVEDVMTWLAVALTPEAARGAAWLLANAGQADLASATCEQGLVNLYAEVPGGHEPPYYELRKPSLLQWGRLIHALDRRRAQDFLVEHIADPATAKGAVATASGLRDGIVVPLLAERARGEGVQQSWQYGSAVQALIAMSTPEAIEALKELTVYYAGNGPNDTPDLGHAGWVLDMLAFRASVQGRHGRLPFWWSDPLPPAPEGADRAALEALQDLVEMLPGEKWCARARKVVDLVLAGEEAAR